MEDKGGCHQPALGYTVGHRAPRDKFSILGPLIITELGHQRYFS